MLLVGDTKGIQSVKSSASYPKGFGLEQVKEENWGRPSNRVYLENMPKKRRRKWQHRPSCRPKNLSPSMHTNNPDGSYPTTTQGFIPVHACNHSGAVRTVCIW